MDTKQTAREISAKLEALGQGSRQGHRPSKQSDFGVYTSDLRALVREYKKLLKAKSADDIHELALALLTLDNTECRQVAYELIAGHKAAREALDSDRVEALGRGIDNWCCVDNFCSSVAGRAWREGRIPDSKIRQWAESSDLWWRRAAVVATVALNTKSRGGKGDTKRTLEICRFLVADKEVMVQKALSWALRELVPWDRAAVEAFLQEEHESVSARVKREVAKKLTTGKKN